MVTVNNVKLIAVYQPVSPNDMEIDEYRKQLETAISCRKKDEMLLIGGDHNAQIGKQDNTGKWEDCGKVRVTSKLGSRGRSRRVGENNNLYMVDTYFRKNNRGTWCHSRTGNWYEPDYFLAKRHRNLIIKDMKMVREDRWSDHRPKMIKRSFRETKEKFKSKYKTRENRIAEATHQETSWWVSGTHKQGLPFKRTLLGRISRNHKRAAKAACGLEDTRSKTSQWLVGHEDRAREFKNGIQRAVKKRNEATNEAQRHNAREELKTVRKEYKQRLREWETEWWEALLVKCEEAMGRQDIGEMYSILKQLGLRGYAVPNSKATVIPAETFKQHFQKVQEKREKNGLTEKVQSRRIIREFAQRHQRDVKWPRSAVQCLQKKTFWKSGRRLRKKHRARRTSEWSTLSQLQ